MNYNFTAEVRESLACAREEAIRLQHDYVGTEHLLLGLLSSGETRAKSIFGQLSIDLAKLQREIERQLREGKGARKLGELPYTSRSKKVLEYTMDEARRQGSRWVGTEHLLLGLIREEKSIAAEVLGTFGMTLDRTRELIGEPADVEVVERSWSRFKGRRKGRQPTFRVRIEDSSDRLIYEQIVEQITEAVATGTLKPLDRLPTVRQLADDAEVAPGTVARAYSELESRGVIVTEGARGTHVAKPGTKGADAGDRQEMLVGLLRPVAVAGFHLGGTAPELRHALEEAMSGIFDKEGEGA